MKIHEFQAKDLFRCYGIPVPAGAEADSPAKARQIAGNLGGNRFAVKAQIHAGGRGKGGGVKVVDSLEAVEKAAEGLLGMALVTPQTGPQGQLVRRVLVEKATGIKKEFYCGLTLDRNLAKPVFMVSPAGGMDIEEVAEKTPELIFKEAVDPRLGLLPFQGRNLALGLGLEGPLFRTAPGILADMYKLFNELDASLAEVNPLVLTGEDQLLALDA
ncbi:MAG: ATP-grasp domain-containing protein, partial [Pseudomonadota bacterium]